MPPDINWNEAAPPTTESAGLGAQQFQSLKTALRTGLDAEHTWASSGVGVGVHRLGSARAYYGPQSLVSSSGTDARLMVTSDTSRLFHVGSAGTMFVGGAAVLSAGSSPVGGQRYYWAHEFGETITGAFGSIQVTIPNSGYSGIPYIVATPSSTSGVLSKAPSITIATKTATSFFVLSYDQNGALYSGVSVDWYSIGTRVF